MAVFPSIMDDHWSTRNKTSPSPVSNRRGGGIFSFCRLYTNQKVKSPLLSKYSREKPSYGPRTINYPTKGKRGSGGLKTASTGTCYLYNYVDVDNEKFFTKS